MDDNERKEVFDRLAAILKENGLDWIVEHVTEQIHNGKTEFVEVETMKRSEDNDVVTSEAGPATPALRRGPKAQFPTTVDYDDNEKLDLLLDGMVQATNVLEMEAEVLQRIKVIEPGIGCEITFYSETPTTPVTVMSPNRVAAKDRVIEDCLDAIRILREESHKA